MNIHVYLKSLVQIRNLLTNNNKTKQSNPLRMKVIQDAK